MSEGSFDGYRECLDRVARERRWLAIVEAPSLEASRAWVKTNLEKGAPFVVACDRDRVVGWCDVGIMTRPGYDHRGSLGMGVLPEYRGRGIGRRLMEEALRRAKERGLERVELEVYAGNIPARRLYDAMGFVEEGYRRGARKLDGVTEDIILMVRFLGS